MPTIEQSRHYWQSSRQRNGDKDRHHLKGPPFEDPIRVEDKSISTVYTAMITNALVTSVKFGAFLATGSASMLSEAIHSLGDSFNQLLLVIGIRRSQQKPDKQHPYGYGRERFVWSLISAVGVFFLGSGVTVYHGISSLVTPPELTDLPIAFMVLGASLILEGGTLYMAIRAIRDGANSLEMSVTEYVLDGPDPMAVAVFVEDSIAVTSVCVSGLALGLTQYYGTPLYDACGSIMVGGLMGTAALFLIEKNRRLLLGSSVPRKKREAMIKFLQADSSILAVHDVKGEVFSPGNMRFKAEIEFNGKEVALKYTQKNYPNLKELHQGLRTPEQLETLLVDYGQGMVQHMGDEVDRIENNLKKRFPSAKHIDLETD